MEWKILQRVENNFIILSVDTKNLKETLPEIYVPDKERSFKSCVKKRKEHGTELFKVLACGYERGGGFLNDEIIQTYQLSKILHGCLLYKWFT